MEAIILVGGRGTRLRPLTARRHKSLLPLGPRRVFDFLLDWVAQNELERAVLALGRHNEDLAAAYSSGRHGGLPLTIVQEPEPLQSGGAIRYACDRAGVSGRFVVLNGDAFIEFPLAPMIAEHEAHDAELSIALHEEEDVSEFGVAELGANGLITSFVEKSPDPPSHLVNAGVWILERHLAEQIDGPVRVEDTLFPELVRGGRRVYGHRFEGLWADVGTPARYRRIVLQLLDRGWPGVNAEAFIHEDATVERSQIGPRCAIGGGSRVVDSILWEDVQIGADANIRASVLADGCVVEDGAAVEGCVLGPATRVTARTKVPPGSVLEAGTEYGGGDD